MAGGLVKTKLGKFRTKRRGTPDSLLVVLNMSKMVSSWISFFLLVSYRPLAVAGNPGNAHREKTPGQPTESPCAGPEESVLGLRSGASTNARGIHEVKS